MMTTPPERDDFCLEQLQIHCSRCSLRDLCLPHGLTAQEMELLEAQVTSGINVSKGMRRIKPGQSLTHLFAVRSGGFKSFRYDSDGDEQVIGFHFPGELFGLDAIHPREHQCYVEALVDSSICSIEYDQLDHVVDGIPALRRQLMNLMSQELGHRADFARNQKSDQAIAAFLLEVSRRMSDRGCDSQRFELLMTRRDIANFLRLRTETVSRVLRRFQDNRWLSVDRKFVEIVDKPGLLSAAA